MTQQESAVTLVCVRVAHTCRVHVCVCVCVCVCVPLDGSGRNVCHEIAAHAAPTINLAASSSSSSPSS